MVVQVGAHAGQVGAHVDAERAQVVGRADAGQQQQLGRADHAAGDDDVAGAAQLGRRATSGGAGCGWRRATGPFWMSRQAGAGQADADRATAPSKTRLVTCAPVMTVSSGLSTTGSMNAVQAWTSGGRP